MSFDSLELNGINNNCGINTLPALQRVKKQSKVV